MDNSSTMLYIKIGSAHKPIMIPINVSLHDLQIELTDNINLTIKDKQGILAFFKEFEYFFFRRTENKFELDNKELVNNLELTMRTMNCLKAEGIETIDELLKWTQVELLKLPQFGKKSMNELNEVLAERGLRLRKR